MSAKPRQPLDLAEALLSAWTVHAETTRYLLDALDEKIWRAPSPDGRGRTIAESFAHIHNVRRMVVVMAKHPKPPAQLDRHRVTPGQARAGLEKSAAAVVDVARTALEGTGRVPGLSRDAAAFIVSAVSHEAHVRGQIASLARRLGAPLSQAQTLEFWDWGKLSKSAAGRKS